jgi:FkbM family methyltransferase
MAQRYRTLAGALAKPKFGEYGWFLDAAIRPGSDVIDIGANVGHFSRQFSRRVAGGRVFAFEPGSFARWVLEKRARLARMDNLHIEALAVSDRCGASVFYSGTKRSGKFNHTGSSLRAKDGWQTRFEERVRTVTIDRFAQAAGITDLSLIKIDAEGAERAILDGAARVLADFKPVIIAEVRDSLLARFGSSARHIWSTMGTAGYRAFDIERGCLASIPRVRDGLHIVFIHRDSPLLARERGCELISLAA